MSEIFDVCIIGSGAGGAVCAYELANKGLKVAIIEEGNFYKKEDYIPLTPLQVLKLLYRDSGISLTIGTPFITIPQGKCVGGTTVINSGTSIRMPKFAYDIWHKEYGFKLTYDELCNYYEKVEKEINVEEVDDDIISKNVDLFKIGAKKMNLDAKKLNRNAKNCKGCGRCFLGCPENAKQSMDINYIPKALNYGAELYTNTKAINILIKRNKVTGVRCYQSNKIIDFYSKIVVLSAGAIFSPVILKNSKLKNKHIGRHLRFHPATRIPGLFDKEIKGFTGIPQAYEIDEFQKEGILIETIFIPPSFLAVSIPFFHIKHKETMKDYKKLAMTGFMIIDSSEGRIFNITSNITQIYYNLKREDLTKIIKGIEICTQILFAAGASKVFTGIDKYPVIEKKEDIKKFKNANIKAKDLDTVLFGFHPLGTLRMGRNEKEAVVDNYGKFFGVDNLFVCDASILPTSPYVNPQLTIMALATYISENIINEIRK